MTRRNRFLLVGLIGLLWFGCLGAAAKETSFGWRDFLAVAGVLLPLIFGVIVYLWKRKQDAERELLEQKLKSIRESITSVQNQLSALSVEMANTSRELLRHQNNCSSKFVMQSTYSNDLQAQKDHLATVKELINQQIDTVEKLMKML